MERPTALRNRDVFRRRGTRSTRGMPPVAVLTTACVGAFPRVWHSTRTGPPRRSTGRVLRFLQDSSTDGHGALHIGVAIGR